MVLNGTINNISVIS